MSYQTYHVYCSDAHGYHVVKRGFSWTAMFFNLYWAIAKRLWWLAGVILLRAFGGLLLLQVAMGPQQFRLPVSLCFLAAEVAGVVYLGMRGNTWIVACLERRGFALSGEVQAGSMREARRLADDLSCSQTPRSAAD